MMRKKFSIILLVSIILSSIFFISTGIKTKAEECNDCDPIPTPPGDADYCPMLPPLQLDPANPNEITAGNSIVIKVLYGSAPFIWEYPGNGYSWASGEVDPENPNNKITNERSNTLLCAAGT